MLREDGTVKSFLPGLAKSEKFSKLRVESANAASPRYSWVHACGLKSRFAFWLMREKIGKILVGRTLNHQIGRRFVKI
jgi:hypothetical protein